MGVVDERLKVRIAAPPVEGQANEALLKWCAKRLQLARRDLDLVAGAGQRRKTVAITCALSAAEIVDRLTGEGR